MITNRVKRIAIVFVSVCLGIFILILGCVITINLFNQIEETSSQAPVRKFRITIDKSQREQLFEQLRKFADKHLFKYEIADFNTNGENFQFSMLRDDITIISGDAPPDQTLVKIKFYRIYPGYPVDDYVFDDLVTDLKDFISEIPNIVILEDE